MIFGGINKAVDKVYHEVLLNQLKLIGIANKLLDRFSSYLSNRRTGCTE